MGRRRSKRKGGGGVFDKAPPPWTQCPEIVITSGKRHLSPYVYGFTTYAKQRWYGRELLEIFSTEFGARPSEYYRRAIACGLVTVNGERVSGARVLGNGDRIVHHTLRREPPVPYSVRESDDGHGNAAVFEVVCDTEDTLAINKPAGIPMHPCGAYHHNSVHYMLMRERARVHFNSNSPEEKESGSLKRARCEEGAVESSSSSGDGGGGVCPGCRHCCMLHIVHRLDRLTSGIALMAKNPAKARELAECIKDGDAHKVYLARVRGQFPPPAQSVARGGWREDDHDGTPGAVRVTAPIRCVSHRDGVYECHEEGKESETVFVCRSFNGRTSLVECRPVTGRTHQIRLHLQWLGCPIANDPCYGGVLFYGESAGDEERVTASRRMFVSRRSKLHGGGDSASSPPPAKTPGKGDAGDGVEASASASASVVPADGEPKGDAGDGVEASASASASVVPADGEPTSVVRGADEPMDAFVARAVRWCNDEDEDGDDKDGDAALSEFNVTQLHCTGIWLHALRYEHKRGEWSYETSTPAWAAERFDK